MAPLLPPVAGASPRSLVQREYDDQRQELQPLFPPRYRPLVIDQEVTEPSRRLMPSSIVRDPGMATYHTGEVLGQGPQRSARSADSPWWWPESLVWRAPARPSLIVAQQWEERWSKTHQRTYWVETSTRETTWKQPVEALHADTEECLQAPQQRLQAPRQPAPPPPRTPRAASWDGPQQDLTGATDASPLKLLAAVTGPGRAALPQHGRARDWASEWIDEWLGNAVRVPSQEQEHEVELEPVPEASTDPGQTPTLQGGQHEQPNQCSALASVQDSQEEPASESQAQAQAQMEPEPCDEGRAAAAECEHVPTQQGCTDVDQEPTQPSELTPEQARHPQSSLEPELVLET